MEERKSFEVTGERLNEVWRMMSDEEIEFERIRNRKPMFEFDIWVGYYNMGQGYDPPTKPQKIHTTISYDFVTACYKYELLQASLYLSKQELKGESLDKQNMRWWYDVDKNENAWVGKYYESEEEAWKSFK